MSVVRCHHVLLPAHLQSGHHSNARLVSPLSSLLSPLSSLLLSRLTESFLDEEFPHLEGRTYLDHAGAGLYSKSQIDGVRDQLMSRLAGNPHSAPENGEMVEEARGLVLRHFNTDSRNYDVVFTSGATASIKEWLETNSVL